MRELLGNILPLFEMPQAHEFDLNKMYDELNAQLFDNKLPKIPVEIEKKLHRGGAAHSVVKAGEKYATPKRITMSDSVNYTDEEAVRGVLAHEMAHIYHDMTAPATTSSVRSLAHKEHAHGKEYQNIIADIQKKADFTIPPLHLDKEKILNFVRFRNKTVDIVMYLRKDINKYLMMFLAKTKDREAFEKQLLRRITRDVNTVYIFYGLPIPKGYETKKVSNSIDTARYAFPIEVDKAQELISTHKPVILDVTKYREEQGEVFRKAREQEKEL